MARGSEQATTAGQSAQNFANTNQGQANATYAALMPELQQEVAHPTGFNPAEEAQMKTSNMQAAGGSQAGATGQGALLAGRTKNPGTAAAAIDASSRHAGQQLGQENLATDVANAKLKQQQRQAGLSGLEGLNAQELGGANQALGIVPQAVNANTNAINASYDWAKDIMDPIIGAAGGAAPTIGKAFGV
jgi:hypothetical protein